jgi:hypothetical protein
MSSLYERSSRCQRQSILLVANSQEAFTGWGGVVTTGVAHTSRIFSTSSAVASSPGPQPPTAEAIRTAGTNNMYDASPRSTDAKTSFTPSPAAIARIDAVRPRASPS